MRENENTISTELRRQLHQIYLTNSERVLTFATSEGNVLLKSQRKPRDAFRFWLLGLVSRIARSPLLLPVPVYGGAKGQAIELRRLREMRSVGLNVPNVLYETAEYFVMQKFKGVPLDDAIAANHEKSTELFVGGLQAIASVHSKGMCLSQGFARNILVNQGCFCFIDFEDDPLEVMTLSQAQARDYLLYMFSTVWLSDRRRSEWQREWVSFRSLIDPEIIEETTETIKKFLWAKCLPKKRRPLGRDATKLRMLSEFFQTY